MSSPLAFSEKGFQAWKKYILQLLDMLYLSNSGGLIILGFIVMQLYELSVWYSHGDNDAKPIKRKDLDKAKDIIGWTDFVRVLYDVRGIVTHSLFLLPETTDSLIAVITNDNFKVLLNMLYEPEDITKFDKLILGYSIWLYQE